MIRLVFAALALECAVVVFAAQAPAPVPPASQEDVRVRKALDASGLKYNSLSNGIFRLEFGYDDGRSQLVFVSSGTETLGAYEVREVWSLAFRSSETCPSPNVLLKIMEDSRRKKIGSWELQREEKGNGCSVRFTAKIPADCSAQVLKDVLRGTAKSADEMEKELTAKDDL